MHIETITYRDYNGVERTEEFAFNLNEAEIVEWLTTTGDYTLDKKLERVAKERNGKEIMATFRDLLYRSFGKVSLDGRRFDKTEEAKLDFMETPAYSVLFMRLVTDAHAAANFVNKIIPQDLAERVNKILAENEGKNPAEIAESLKQEAPVSSGTANLTVVSGGADQQ